MKSNHFQLSDRELSQKSHFVPTDEKVRHLFILYISTQWATTPTDSIFYRASSAPKQILKDQLKKIREAKLDRDRKKKKSHYTVTSSKVSGGKYR